jgi:DNA-binding NarL/FixJ family response regulator
VLTTVLLADDHGVLRDSLRELLNSHADIRVVAEAANGPDAVRLAAAHKPSIAILDIAMPDLTGIEAMRQIARAAPQTRMLALSFHGESEIIREAFLAGAHGYLTKASAAMEVVRAVRVLMAGRRYLGPGVAEAMIGVLGADGAMAQSADVLSPREREILRLVTEGRTNAQIAALLELSPRTVETYRLRLMDKLGIEDLPSLVKFAIRHGITSAE